MSDINANEAAFKLLTGQALTSAESSALRDKLVLGSSDTVLFGSVQLPSGGVIGVLGGETLTIGKISGGGNAILNIAANTTWTKDLTLDNTSGLQFGSTAGANKISANTGSTFTFGKLGGGLASYSFSGEVGDVRFSNERVFVSNLPTSDPLSADQLWNDGGTVKVSAG